MTTADRLSMKTRKSAVANAAMQAVYEDFGATNTYEYTLYRFADGSALEAKYNFDGDLIGIDTRDPQGS